MGNRRIEINQSTTVSKLFKSLAAGAAAVSIMALSGQTGNLLSILDANENLIAGIDAEGEVFGPDFVSRHGEAGEFSLNSFYDIFDFSSPSDGDVLTYDLASGTYQPQAAGGGGGSGDVVGPSSSTDNAFPVFDGTTGRLLKDFPNDAMSVNATTGRVNFFNPTKLRTLRLGDTAQATDNDSTAIGYFARADLRGLAIGRSASTGGYDDATAIGYIAQVTGARGFAMGRQAIAGQTSVALGYQANASGLSATSIGNGAQALDVSAVSIGNQSKARADFSIGIGELVDIDATANNSIAIGRRAKSSHLFGITLGTLTDTTADNQFLVGNGWQHPLKEFHFGSGSEGHYTWSLPSIGDTEIYFNEYNSSVSDASPYDVIFNAPAGKGTGDGGHLVFKTSPAGTSGATRNAGQVTLEIDDEGNVIMPRLPTSSSGLPSGALWNDAGTLKVVP